MMMLRRGFLVGVGATAVRLLATTASPAAAPPPVWPHVGTYDFLGDPTINFQLNRWVSLGGDPLRHEIEAMLPRLGTLEGCRNEFSAASDRTLAAGNPYEAAILARGADFFMVASDARKRRLRERFVSIMRASWGVGEPDHVPFGNGYLPLYRFTPANPRGTIVVFGGFDSYIEEFFPIMLNLRDQGHDVVAFEGPGQGGALEDRGLAMTPDWQRPVGAILDRLSLSGVTLIGISLGGCLVIRAAAHEPRVSRVVAWDALSDFLESILHQVPPTGQTVLRALLSVHADAVIDPMVSRSARNPVQEWGLAQAMHVFGVNSPAAALRAAAGYRTQEISPLVRQDVLLLAGAEDHYVPAHQVYDQAAGLTNARSVTTRMFSRSESAQAHCQIGNLPLVIRTITEWLDRRV
jgi:alpha-beta hydrolase superfamily lysophospholipase